MSKKLFVSILAVLFLGACSAPTSSSPGATPNTESEHTTHTYSINWSFNNTHHWHKCTGCDEKTDYSEHIFLAGNTCIVCGCVKQQTPTNTGYTVKWKNWNGTTLETDYNVEYGAIPSYDGATPERNGDGEHLFEFIGWSPTPGPVVQNITYVAQYKSSNNPLFCKHEYYEGNVCLDCGEVFIGEQLTTTWEDVFSYSPSKVNFRMPNVVDYENQVVYGTDECSYILNGEGLYEFEGTNYMTMLLGTGPVNTPVYNSKTGSYTVTVETNYSGLRLGTYDIYLKNNRVFLAVAQGNNVYQTIRTFYDNIEITRFTENGYRYVYFSDLDTYFLSDVPSDVTTLTLEDSYKDGKPLFNNFNYWQYSIFSQLTSVTINTNQDVSSLFRHELTNLSSVILGSKCHSLVDDQGVIYSKNYKELLFYPSCKTDTEYQIHEGCEEISRNAISNNPYIETIYFSDSIIKTNYCSISNCENLKTVYVNDVIFDFSYDTIYNCDSIQLNVLNNIYYYGSVNNPYRILARYGDYDVYGAISETCELILYGAKNWWSHIENDIKEYAIPDSVKIIQNGALSFGLDTLYIGKGLQNFGDSSWNNIKSFVIDPENLYVTCDENAIFSKDGKQLFIFTNKDFNKVYSIPEGVEEIHKNAFNGSNVTSIIFPSTIKRIDDYAFSGAQSLVSISLPDNLDYLGMRIFEYCSNLKNVTIGNNVKKFGGADLFGTEAYLDTLTFGNPMPEVDWRCISRDTVIVLPENNDRYVIYNGDIYSPDLSTLYSVRVKNTDNYVIPEHVRAIYYYALSNLNFKTVTIPETVLSVSPGFWTQPANSLLLVARSEEEATKMFGYQWNWEITNICYEYDGKDHTYIFDTCGGNEIPSVTVKYLDHFPYPTRDGYHFEGWYDNPSYEGSKTTNIYYSKDGATLYAKWMSDDEFDDYYNGSSSTRPLKYLITEENCSDSLLLEEGNTWFFFENGIDKTIQIAVSRSSGDVSIYINGPYGLFGGMLGTSYIRLDPGETANATIYVYGNEDAEVNIAISLYEPQP